MLRDFLEKFVSILIPFRLAILLLSRVQFLIHNVLVISRTLYLTASP
jgi:hypothetical protein